MIMRFILAILLVGLFGVDLSAQRVEEGWKGLLPFKSTKADVEKLFGNGKTTEHNRHYQFEYKTETGTFRVDYSGDPCDPSAEYSERYNLPAATILHYEVQLVTPVPLENFTFDVNRFERTVMIYGPNKEPRAISYVQWEFDRWKVPNQAGVGNGIEIQITGSEDRELVTRFLYSPPYDRTKFTCSELK
jgi:hypothetical protein